MTVHLPLLLLVLVLGYLGYRLARPPLWLVVMLVLVGYLSARTFVAPAIESGARAGVEILDGTTK